MFREVRIRIDGHRVRHPPELRRSLKVNWRKRLPLWVIHARGGDLRRASSPSLVLFVLVMAYGLSGYVMWAMGHRVRPVLPEE